MHENERFVGEPFQWTLSASIENSVVSLLPVTIY